MRATWRSSVSYLWNMQSYTKIKLVPPDVCVRVQALQQQKKKKTKAFNSNKTPRTSFIYMNNKSAIKHWQRIFNIINDIFIYCACVCVISIGFLCVRFRLMPRTFIRNRFERFYPFYLFNFYHTNINNLYVGIGFYFYIYIYNK